MGRPKKQPDDIKLEFTLDTGPCCDHTCEIPNTNGLFIDISPEKDGIHMFICEYHAKILANKILEILK